MSDALFVCLANAETRLIGWGNLIRDPSKFQPVMKAEFDRAFELRERLKCEALNADPVRYARTYPGNAYGIRHLLPADMVARIEAAETDADMIAAVAGAEPDTFEHAELAAAELTDTGFKPVPVTAGYWGHDDLRRAAIVRTDSGRFRIQHFPAPKASAMVTP